MDRTKHLALLLGLALTLGVVQVVGCAGPEPAGEQALAEADPVAGLAAAEDAYQQEDYERARRLFQRLPEAEELTDAQREAARSRLERIASILHQREIAGPEEAAPEVAEAEAEPAPEEHPAEAAQAEPAPEEHPAEAAQAEPAPEEHPADAAAQEHPAEVAQAEPAPEEQAEPAEEEPAEEAIDPEAARAEAAELLAGAEALVAEGKHAEARPALEALDELRQYLPPDARARYDLARAAVQEATGELAPLSEDVRAARAQQQFDVGMRAYKDDNYPAAKLHLDAAASCDVSIGWWDNRALRKARQTIAETFSAIEADLARARQLHEEGHYDEAAAVLRDVAQKQAAVGLDAEPARELLAEVEAAQARAAQEALEEQRQIVAELLETARDAVEAEDYRAASDALNDVMDRAESLTVEQAEQFKGLAAAVEQATGVSPTLSEAERLARAKQNYKWGMDAYEDGRYAKAEQYLLQVQRLEADLGRRREAKVRAALAEIVPVLERLRVDYARARQLYEDAQYAEAEALVKQIRAGGINIGDEKMAELEDLLASIEQKKARQEQERLAARRQEAAQMLARAEELGAEERYDAAAQKLEELSAQTDLLEAGQRQRYDGLCAAVERATGLMPGATTAEVLARAEQYYQWGIDAYTEGRYAQAQGLLARADALDADLGGRRSRRLNAALAEVNRVLETLRADLQQARDLVQAGQYAQAVSALQRIRQSGVSLGDEADAEAVELLARAEAGVEEQLRAEQEAHRKRVAQLLAEAETLAGEGHYAAAMGKLALLAELPEHVTGEQQARADQLRTTLAQAAKAAEAQERLARAEELVARAQGMLRARRAVHAKMESAQQAAARGDFERAKALLDEARAALQGLDADEPGVAEMVALVEQRQAEVEEAARSAARRAEAEGRLNALAAEARAVLSRDVLAAERKVNEMVQVAEEAGIDLAPRHQMVRELVLDSVEAVYGARRRTMRKIFVELPEMADDYLRTGEPAKAAQVLSLAEHAPDEVLSVEAKAEAQQTMAVAREAAQAQKELARQLQQVLAQMGAAEALDQAQAVLSSAREQNLASAPMADLLRAAEEALVGPVQEAIDRASGAMAGAVEERLEAARPVLGRRLAEHYLGANAPEQARPYLKKLAASGPADAAAWAEARLATIDALAGAAEQARTLKVTAETDRVFALAQELHELVQQGRLADAEAVERELADARLELQVRRAEMAIERGAYMEASRLLAEGTVAEADPATVDAVYRPVKKWLETLRTAAGKLEQAEEAMAQGDLETAGRMLTETRRAGTDAGPLGIKAEVLGGVLEGVLEAREGLVAVQAVRDRLLEDVRADLARATQRGEAWRRYYGALKAFLTGQTDAEAVRQVLADPAGLEPFELAQAERIAEALAGGMGTSEGARLLAEAQAAYAGEDYLAAAALLAELRDLPRAEVGRDVLSEADRLQSQIQAREAEARELYAEAVRAYRADDAERVRELTARLREEYSHTRAYAENR